MIASTEPEGSVLLLFFLFVIVFHYSTTVSALYKGCVNSMGPLRVVSGALLVFIALHSVKSYLCYIDI